MSVDVVDDLHAAEDMAASLAAALDAVMHVDPEGERWWEDPAFAAAEARLAEWHSYCRPGCGAAGDPESDECDDDTCGCPCGHIDARDVTTSA